MNFRWISNLWLKENLGKVLSIASVVVTLGYIAFSSKEKPQQESKEEPVGSLKEAELDKMSQKRTRKTFLSEDDANEDNYEVPTLTELTERRKALGNTYFMSDNEPKTQRQKKLKVLSFADDQQLDRFHLEIGKSLDKNLLWM